MSGGAGADLATAETVFAASRCLFDQVTEELGSTDAAALTHSQLEDLLGSRMREVTRQLFQDGCRSFEGLAHLRFCTDRVHRPTEPIAADLPVCLSRHPLVRVGAVRPGVTDMA